MSLVQSLVIGLLLQFVWVFQSAAIPAEECDACTFVLMKEGEGVTFIANRQRASMRMPPFSTFKVANSLIAIELGVVEDLQQRLTFDRQRYPIQSWWPESWFSQPLSLDKAFEFSALPIYQNIALQINPDRMQKFVRQFNYGNRDISSGVDSFWLNGSMKISALEQVIFLQKVFNNKVDLDPKTILALRQIMLMEKTGDHAMFAKTGGGMVGSNNALGWYVGVIEKLNERYYFALNLDKATFAEVRQARIDLTLNYLNKLFVL